MPKDVKRPIDWMLHRPDYEGAEREAYDRGWLDGYSDTKGENLVTGLLHGLFVGAAFAATVAVIIHMWWTK